MPTKTPSKSGAVTPAASRPAGPSIRAGAPVFGAVRTLPVRTVPGKSVRGTVNGGVLSVLMDNSTLRLGGQALFDALTVRFSVGLRSGDQPLLVLSQTIRGAVSKPADARVLIIAEAGGAKGSLEIPYGEARDGAASGFDLTFFGVDDRRVGPDPDALRPARPYVATITCLAERRERGGDVLVQIDSLDAAVFGAGRAEGGAQ